MSKMDALVGEEPKAPEVQVEPGETIAEPVGDTLARDTWYREDRRGAHHSVIHLPFKPIREMVNQIEGIAGISRCSHDHNGHSIELRSAEMFDHDRVLARVIEYLGGIHTRREVPGSSEGWGEDWFLSTGASLASMIIPCGILMLMASFPSPALGAMVWIMIASYFLVVLGHQLYIRRQARKLHQHVRPM